MNEFALLLKMMSEPHPAWERQPEPVAIVQQAPAKPPVERLGNWDQALYDACQRIADHATGNMLLGPATGFWVPEQK